MKEDFIKEKSAQLKIPEAGLVRVMTSALKETEEQLLHLNNAVSKSDYNGIKSLAHRIKGYLLNLKIDALGGLADEVDTLATNQADMGEIKEKYEHLRTGFETFKKEIEL